MSTENDAAVATEPKTLADGATQKDSAEAADDENTNKDINDADVDQPKDTESKGGAPQAKLSETEAMSAPAPASPGGGEKSSDEFFEDCKISPLDADNQRRNLKSALLNTEPVEPTTTAAEDDTEESNNNQQTSSLLHEDEFSHH